jgi:Protein of unknown function (DUF3014)
VTRLVQGISGLAVLAALGGFGLNWYLQHQPPQEIAPFEILPGDAVLIPTPPAEATQSGPDTPADETAAELPSGETPSPEVAVENPLTLVPSPTPLAGLAESDPQIVASLVELIDLATLQQYFQLESLARKFVLCVDNLPAGKLAPQNRVVKPVSGRFAVRETDDEIVLNEANYARYTPLIDVLTGLDAGQIARVYRNSYPLLQLAYEDLGYPGKYFNDRLVAVIDHLLAASPLSGPVLLVQPKVFYRYADPVLEAASVGHKILFRIGPEQMAKVQMWLGAVRAEVATEAARSP